MEKCSFTNLVLGNPNNVFIIFFLINLLKNLCCWAMNARRPIAKYFQLIVETWTWDASRWRAPIALSICEREAPNLLMGTSDFDTGRKVRPDCCPYVSALRPTSWWECLFLTDKASAKRTTTNYDLLRGWWQIYGISAEGKWIESTRASLT